MVGHETKAQALIDRSLLPDELKVRYAAVLADRRQRLRYQRHLANPGRLATVQGGRPVNGALLYAANIT